jgi:hypothetical protein
LRASAFYFPPASNQWAAIMSKNTKKPSGTQHILLRDFESRGVLNLKDVGAWRYATHPATDVLCCAYAVDDGPVKLWVPGDPVPPEFIEVADDPSWVVSAFNDNLSGKSKLTSWRHATAGQSSQLSGTDAYRLRRCPWRCPPRWRRWPRLSASNSKRTIPASST